MKQLAKAFSIFGLCMSLAMVLASAAARAETYTAGKDYAEVTAQPTASGDKVEVLEFFWYGCPHCNTFEPFLKSWKKTLADNVEFIRVPTVFRPSWKVHARAYYALQAMGKIEEIHPKIFDAMHKQRKRLDSMNKIADFVAEQGVDREQFIKQYQSFGIDGKVRKANTLVKNYGITGVPAIAINGKYKVDGRMAGSYERMIKIMDYLIAKESK